jgi:hypothetical protein
MAISSEQGQVYTNGRFYRLMPLMNTVEIKLKKNILLASWQQA